MKDQEPSLNQMNESEITTALFNEKIKSARMKSAVVAGIPTLIILTALITSPPSGKDVAPNLIAIILFTVIPFTLFYQFVFCLGFGKKLLTTLYKQQKFFEPMPYAYLDTDRAIDALNVANGHAPGKGFLMPARQTNIDWDSHH